MGRGADSYTYVAVELDIAEMRAWLSANKKSYNDGDFGNTPVDHYEIASGWATYYDVSKTKPDVFASVNYEDGTINGLYYGIKLYDVYLNAYADGWTSVEEIDFAKVQKHAQTVQSFFPKKKVRIVTIQSVG